MHKVEAQAILAGLLYCGAGVGIAGPLFLMASPARTGAASSPLLKLEEAATESASPSQHHTFVRL